MGPMISNASRNKLQKAQNSCLSHLQKTKNVWPAAKKNYKILNVCDIIKLELCKLGYKLSNGLLPTPLLNSLRCDQNNNSLNKTHKYSTRNKAVPNSPRPKTKLYHKSFLCKCITEYQSFMVATGNCNNLNHFIACCKKLLHER